MRALCLTLVAVCCQAAEVRFTSELRTSIEPIYARTLQHPFLKGLADGSLARSHFQFYLIQDAHYLRAFAQALSVLAAKAPREDWAVTLSHDLNSEEGKRIPDYFRLF